MTEISGKIPTRFNGIAFILVKTSKPASEHTGTEKLAAGGEDESAFSQLCIIFMNITQCKGLSII